MNALSPGHPYEARLADMAANTSCDPQEKNRMSSKYPDWPLIKAIAVAAIPLTATFCAVAALGFWTAG